MSPLVKVLVMVCHLFSAKPSPEHYNDLLSTRSWEQAWVKFESNYYYKIFLQKKFQIVVCKIQPFFSGPDFQHILFACNILIRYLTFLSPLLFFTFNLIRLPVTELYPWSPWVPMYWKAILVTAWLTWKNSPHQGSSQYRDRLSRYEDSHVKDKMVVRPSYL